MNKNIRGLITLGILILCLGGCFYYFFNQPDCIKMTADGSVRCSCDFSSNDEWNKFKDNTEGLNHDGWEAVGFPNGYNPCTVHAPVENNVNNTSNDTQTYKSQSELQQRIDEDNSNVIKDTVNKDTVAPIINQLQRQPAEQIDSVPLLRLNKGDEKLGLYISDKLPLSYANRNSKYTFFMDDSLIKVKCYTDGKLNDTFTCTLNENIITVENGDGFFSFNDGKLFLVLRDKHIYYQLYMSN